jgi:YcaO-like protein with predicted kinase domain
MRDGSSSVRLSRITRTSSRTFKRLKRGTHRSEDLERTITRVLRLAPVMGITRVANVTGLDAIGIPVVMVSRPNSRSITVSQGKGINLAAARASGLMESAELYHAETITLPLRLASYEELRFKYNVVEVADLPRRASFHFHPNLRTLWCKGHDLLNDEDILVPYEMVHTNYTSPLPDGHGCFIASSNGLASGNNLIEAIGQGLCELIERDATALWKARGERMNKRRIHLNTVDDPDCRETIAKFERAGFCVAVWDITSDIMIATFACSLVPRDNQSLWHPAASAGYGCHPAREIALLRALTEAAQTRLTVISGLRDDLYGETYEQLMDPDFTNQSRHRVGQFRLGRRFRDVPTRNSKTFEADLAWELKCIRNAGLRRAIVIDLTKRELGLSVVRVIVPGLEPILGTGYSPGRRAQLAMKPKA